MNATATHDVRPSSTDCTLVLLSPATPANHEEGSAVLVGDVVSLIAATADLQYGSRASILGPNGEWVFTIGPVHEQAPHQSLDHVPNRFEAA